MGRFLSATDGTKVANIQSHSSGRSRSVIRRASEASSSIRFYFATGPVESLLSESTVSNRQLAPRYNPCRVMSDSLKPQAMPTGPERELQLYAQGLVGGKPSVPVPLHLLEQKAKEILEPRAYDYVAGGAGGEDTVRAHPGAFFPRPIFSPVLRGVAKRDLWGGGRRVRPPPPPSLAPLRL